MPSRKKRLNLTLEPEAMENLAILSQAMNKPMSTIVKELIEPLLEQTQYLLDIANKIDKDKTKLKTLENDLDKTLEDLNSEAHALVRQMRIKVNE